MKVCNIHKRLIKIGAKDIKISVARTNWGHYAKLTARIGGYYDVEVTEQISDSEHTMSRTEVNKVFMAADADEFHTKPHHDESDPMTDYCAWTFHRTINSLNHYAHRVAA